MSDIDKKINVLDHEGIKSKLAYFRLRSAYNLEDSVKKTYMSESRKYLEIIVKDLIDREGYDALATLFETGVVTNRNFSNIIEKHNSVLGTEFVSKMNELKMGLKNK